MHGWAGAVVVVGCQCWALRGALHRAKALSQWIQALVRQLLLSETSHPREHRSVSPGTSLAFVGIRQHVRTLPGLELPPYVSVRVAFSDCDLGVPQLARIESHFKNMCVVM